jgi:hypothetical protein
MLKMICIYPLILALSAGDVLGHMHSQIDATLHNGASLGPHTGFDMSELLSEVSQDPKNEDFDIITLSDPEIDKGKDALKEKYGSAILQRGQLGQNQFWDPILRLESGDPFRLGYHTGQNLHFVDRPVIGSTPIACPPTVELTHTVHVPMMESTTEMHLPIPSTPLDVKTESLPLQKEAKSKRRRVKRRLEDAEIETSGSKPRSPDSPMSLLDMVQAASINTISDQQTLFSIIMGASKTVLEAKYTTEHVAILTKFFKLYDMTIPIVPYEPPIDVSQMSRQGSAKEAGKRNRDKHTRLYRKNRESALVAMINVLVHVLSRNFNSPRATS